MRYHLSPSSSLALIHLLSPLAQALTDATVGNDFIRFPVTPVTNPNTGMVKRQDGVLLKNQQTGTLYTINVNMGTPPQSVTVALDTGSSEMWVNPTCANAGTPFTADFCNELSRFSANSSSTLKNLMTSGKLQYGKGQLLFDYMSDNVGFGSATLKAQQFGLAKSSVGLETGVFGVGPPLGASDPASKYPLVLDSLKSQGFIASRAFSLDIRDVDSPDGSIIFGGIDTQKYQGTLEKIPIIDPSTTPDKKSRYWIAVNGVSFASADGTSKTLRRSADSFPVVLDSGSTLSYLPGSLLTAIAAEFPSAQYDPSGFYIVDCSYSNVRGSVNFVFGGKTIEISFKNFIWNMPVPNTDGTKICVLGMQNATQNVSILGDSFLRSAYAVFDQDNANIHLAQADNCGTNLVAIGSGTDAVPSITGGCGGSALSTSLSTTTSSTSARSTSSMNSSTSEGSTSSTISSPTTHGSSTRPSASASSTAVGASASSTVIPGSSTAAPWTSSSTSTRAGTSFAQNTSLPSTSAIYSTKTSQPSGETSILPPFYSITTSAGEITYISTATSPSVYTITSCPPTVTNCPIGHVTTDILTYTTTWCPENSGFLSSTDKVQSLTTYTSRLTSTSTFTVMSCASTISNCPAGTVTTSEIIYSSTWCPDDGSSVSTAGVEPLTTYTSTLTATNTFTVTSCAPALTDCPVGHVTTSEAVYTTTWCRENGESPPYPQPAPSSNKPATTETSTANPGEEPGPIAETRTMTLVTTSSALAVGGQSSMKESAETTVVAVTSSTGVATGSTAKPSAVVTAGGVRVVFSLVPEMVVCVVVVFAL